MNLIIDIGNSRTKLVAFDGDDAADQSIAEGHSLELLAGFCQRHTFSAAIVSSVIDITPEACEALHQLPCPLLTFAADTPTPLHNRYRTPATLGRDRLAAAVGAATLLPRHSLLIADMGSCITFDFVSDRGTFVGGNITPGLHARLRAIDEFFPRLPHVDTDGDLPELGYDTPTAIRAGVVRGIIHELNGYIDFYSRRYPNLHTFVTGGDADIIVRHNARHTTIDPLLVARGLNVILDYNLQRNTITTNPR